MMTGINRRPTDTQGEDGKGPGDVTGQPAHQGIEKGTETIGAVQGGNGSKDIGITTVKVVEEGNTQQTVETGQRRLTAQGIIDGLGAIHCHIPWGSRRMNIIAHESQEVDEQKRPGETQEESASARTEEIKGKEQRDGYPTEVEETCQQIGKGEVMYREIFVQGNPLPINYQSEEVLLCLIDVQDVHLVDHIVGIDTHKVVGGTEDDERDHSHGKLAREGREEETKEEKTGKEEMLDAIANEQGTDRIIDHPQRNADRDLTTTG